MASNKNIKDIVKQIEQKMKETGDSNPRKEVLSSMILLLMNTKNNDEGRIACALDFLKQVPFYQYQDMFSRIELPSLVDIHNQHINAKNKSTNTGIKPLFSDDISFFKGVHFELKKIYDNIIKWEYTFPLDKKTGSADHPVLAQWCKDMSEVSENEEQHSDLHRGISIFSRRARSHTEGIKAIDELLRNTSYNIIQKAMLEKWLTTRGGQCVYSIISDLSLNKCFSDTHVYPGFSKLIAANWHVVNKEVQIDFAIDYFAFHDDHHNQLVITRDGETLKINGPEAAEKFKEDELSPLMRAKVRLQFDVGKTNVIPKITQLDFTGFTNDLRVPKATPEKPKATKGESDPKKKSAIKQGEDIEQGGIKMKRMP